MTQTYKNTNIGEYWIYIGLNTKASTNDKQCSQIRLHTLDLHTIRVNLYTVEPWLTINLYPVNLSKYQTNPLTNNSD